MSALSQSKIDYAIAKINEIGIRANGTAEAEALDIIAFDAAAELAQLRAKLTPMQCGHIAANVVNGDEGTSYCAICAMEAEIESLRAELAAKDAALEEARDILQLASAMGQSIATEWLSKHKAGDE